MLVKDTMCYTQLLELMQDPKFVKSISKVTFTQPQLDTEGFNGYIETVVEFEVNGDLESFASALRIARLRDSEIYWYYRRKLLPQG